MNKLVIFAAGVAVGSLVTWKLVKTRYEQYANEEIKSVKETYARREVEKRTEQSTEEELKEEPDLSEYKNVLKQSGYRNYSNSPQFEDAVTDEEVSASKRPYVISPQEYNDGEYAVQSLTYYADGVLVDDDGEPVENIDALVGVDSLSRFGEYEEDSVFVRNDVLGIDFEILADARNYFDTYPE